MKPKTKSESEPPHYNSISLKPIIYNQDIDQLTKKNSISIDESSLLKYKKAKETIIQSHARNTFNHLKQEISFSHPKAILEFVQFDNGANLTEIGKFKKWREGTVSGFPDIQLLIAIGQYSMVTFVEFKRIGSPAQIIITEHQEYWNKRLKEMGWSAYITNNPLYFSKVICQEIKDFLNKYK